MPTWTVNLIGDPADLEALAALDGGVVREGAAFVFQSTDLDSLAEASAFEQVVVQRIEVLKGLLRVMTGDKRVRTVTTGVLRREENGRTNYFVIHGTGELEMLGGNLGDRRAWVAAALRDPENAGWALQLFAGEPTPATLYKVFEVIRSDLGGSKEIVRRGWTTRNAIARFTRTVDSPQHLGVQARHGVQKGDPMPAKKVMTVREMRDFIRGLMVKWLDSK